MTHFIFHLISLFITLFDLARAQWQWSGLHYQPQRLIWTKQEQFDWLWSEPDYKPVMKLPNTPLERCNRLCWESDYQYTYFMAKTQNCICSNKYTWAYEVNVAPNPSFDQDIFPRFTMLNANFQPLPCISKPSAISYYNSSTGPYTIDYSISFSSAYSTMTMLVLFVVLSVCLKYALAQDRFNGTQYGPERLTCATAEWFDHVSHDTDYVGVLRPESDVWYCRFNCNADNYNLAYWQTSSGLCYCSLGQEVPADQVGNAISNVDGCWSGTNARLDDLQADYDSEWCTNDLLGQTPTLTSSAPTILGCIGGCGYPQRIDFPASYTITAAIPRYDNTMQEYNYLCQCFDHQIETYNDAVGCGFGKVHWVQRIRWYIED
ncbi:hypothetical protein I302_104245 [Kwoniella bestiolae CBS 10118]|uniref:WSC domain-containing protein n=1 Tax=Kwoniella bestiolae CBS 10118 TaxID=1296100 RepID=A0A1B9GAQ1_9TREE|nr:hypothetical protein I302_02954 [Kwoniella bestiolae CBS 10118]OCF28103.1 hypothetical protein I302_02954 [Kwoniella bestiolae CBS 10118]